MSTVTSQVTRRGTTTLVNGLTGTGASSILFNSILQQNVDSATLLVQAINTGTFSALTYVLELSLDAGNDWATVSAWDALADPVATFQTSEVGLYRFHCTSFAGGTASTVLGALAGVASGLTPSNSSSSTVTASQGTPGTLANAWPVEVTDGTSVLATSSHPVRVDPTGTTVQPVSISGSVPVTGTFWQATQPVSIAATLSDNIAQWGGTAVTAAVAAGGPATGQEVAPVVRNIGRKAQDVSSTANIAASTTYTSSWVDTQATGAVYAIYSFVFPSAGFGSNAVGIQGSDDNGTHITTLVTGTPTANTLGTITAFIPTRYFRAYFINGSTLQTTPYISVTTSPAPIPQTFALTTNNALEVLGTGSAASNDGTACSTMFDIGGSNKMLGVANYFCSTGPNNQAAVWSGGRSPSIVKTATATASGDTALWTPTTGKKFRILKFRVEVTANAAISGGAAVLTIKLRDSTTDTSLSSDVFIPATAATTMAGGYVSPWVDLGFFGVISATANNVLNINLSTALTTGNVRVVACGTEE